MSAPDFKDKPRVIADRDGWEGLRRVKLDGQGCRVCGLTSFRVQLHHLVARGRLGLGGGDDLPENLVPLCPEHHGLVEAWDIATRHRLRETLTQDEVYYCVSRKSADWFANSYPAVVTYCAERGRVERVVAGLCEGCGEPAEVRSLVYEDVCENDDRPEASEKVCGFCKGEPVGDAASWLDGKPRPAAPCPRCGKTAGVA